MTSTERARRKYDEIADRYEELFFYVADAGRALIDFADPAPGSRALDVGAGRGAVARAALARGCAVTAVDASPRMVSRLAADYPEITARELDATSLDFPAGSFDLVTAGFVIQVLPDPLAALTGWRQVLAAGGTIALSLETQSLTRLRWLTDLSTEFFGAPPTAPDGPAPLSAPTLDTLLTEAGFVDVTRQSVEIPLHLADPPALWDWLAPRGVADAITRLPAEAAADFHRRVLAAAETMRVGGTIVLDFAATLHRARLPLTQQNAGPSEDRRSRGG